MPVSISQPSSLKQETRTLRACRSPPENLFDKRVDIRQMLLIGKSRQATHPQDGIDLLLCAFLYVWVQGHAEEEGMNG
jgi:hypothetical protein